VVRSLSVLGRWKGGQVALQLPAARDRILRSAILVQSGTGGPIIAAAKL